MQPAAPEPSSPGTGWTRIAAVFVVVYALGGPFSIFIAQVGIFGALMAGLAAPAVARQALSRNRLLGVALATYFLVQMASIIYSVHPLRSVICLRGDWPVVFLPIFLVVLQSRSAQRRGLAMLLLAVALAGGLGLWQHLSGTDPLRGQVLEADGAGRFHAIGGYRGHLTYGGVMLVGFLTALFLWMASRGRQRAWLTLVVLLAAAGLTTSYARSALLGGVGGATAGCATLLWVHRRAGAGSRWRWLASGLGGLTLLAIVVLASPGLLDRILEAQHLSQMPRIRLWGTALAIFADHPILGAGLGAFKTLFDTYRLPGEYMAVGHPHNDALNVMVHSGIAGLIAWAGLWIAIMRGVLVRATQDAPPAAQTKRPSLLETFARARLALGVGLVAGFLTAGLAQCYFTDEEPAAMLWFVTAMLLSVGAPRASRHGASGPEARSKGRRRLGKRFERWVKGAGLPLAARLLLGRRSPPVEAAPIDLQRAQRILLIRQDSRLGNLVLLTPFLQALREAAGEARITILVGDRFADVLRDVPWIDEFIVERKRWLIRHPWAYGGFLRRVRGSRRWDVVFELSNPNTHSFYNCLLTAVSGGSLRVGFDHPRSRVVLTTPIAPPPDPCHFSLAPLALLEAFGPTPNPRPLCLPTDRRTLRRRASSPTATLRPDSPAGPCLATSAEPFARDVLIHVGGRGGKGWPSKAFAQLLDALTAEERGRVGLIGGPGERSRLQTLARAHPSVPHAIFGRYDELRTALSRARLYLGCDAGPLHVAAALGLRTVSLFVSSHPLRYAPLGPDHLCLVLGRRSRAYVASAPRPETELCRPRPRMRLAPSGLDPSAEAAFVAAALREGMASLPEMCDDPGRQSQSTVTADSGGR